MAGVLVRGCPLSGKVSFGEIFWFHNEFRPVSCSHCTQLNPPRASVCVCVFLFVSLASEICELYETLALSDRCTLLGDSMTFISHLGLACLMSY